MRNCVAVSLLVFSMFGQTELPPGVKVVGEWAVIEGDIIIGRAKDLAKASDAPGRSGLILPQTGGRWPRIGAVHQVPYTNPGNFGPAEEAVRLFNATFRNVIQWTPRTTEADYVEFQIAPGAENSCGGSSFVGRVGGRQLIDGQGSGQICVGVLLHEMGHSVGLFHEHSRKDRDQYVKLLWDNISDRSQYEAENNSRDTGLYDANSVMHYSVATFAAESSNVTLESIPTGIPLRNETTYSAGDIDVIRRMYNAAPTQVTIATNPPGLSVTVDGQAVQLAGAGRAFDWAMDSNHTLEIAANQQFQSLDGRDYLFGRWNHTAYNPATAMQPQPVKVTAGDGSADVIPAGRPVITAYLANFRQLLRATAVAEPAAEPAEGGQARIATAPSQINGTPYYFQYQPVLMEAIPAAGFNFHGWTADETQSSLGDNPREFRAGLAANVVARFTRDPITAITTNPAGLRFKVNGAEYRGTRNFAAQYDNGWTAGSTHSISVDSPQPFIGADPRARMVFQGWSDNGAQTHNITAGGSQRLTANFVAQFALGFTQNTNGACGADITTQPASADGLFNAGSTVTVTATPRAGWNFIRWEGPAIAPGTATTPVLVDASKDLRAILNVNREPLAIANVSPASVPLNSANVTITLNGTGFAPDSQLCVFDAGGTESRECLTPTFVSSNRLTAELNATLFNQAQNLRLTLTNSAGNCQAETNAELPVRNAAAMSLLPSKP